MAITTTTIGAAISGFTGGGGGGLGTLLMRLVADATNLVKGMNQAQTSVTKGTASMTKAVVGMAASFASITAGMGLVAVREFGKFEASFTNVRKTVDASEAEFQRLSAAFRQMSKDIPVNVNEINRVAAAAGQLGIQTKHIEDFTKTMLYMGETTNLSSDEAADAMARFANITQMPQEAFDQLGSTISALDKDSASTAKEIMQMALRLAGSGVQAGLTKTEILGLSSAMSSVGIQAELGGSAMSQVMIRMTKAVQTGGKELEVFAELAQMTSEEFTQSFIKGSGPTLLKFIQGIKASTEAGKDVFSLMEKLGTDGIRVTQTLLGLSNAGDLLAKHLGTSSQAWKENTSLVKMAEERFKTFNAQIVISFNMVKDVMITIGESLAPHLLKLNSALQESMRDTNGWTASVKQWVDDTIPGFIRGIGMMGDAFNYFRRLMKAGGLIFVTLGEVWLKGLRTAAKGIKFTLESIVNGYLSGVNLAIRAANLLLPKAREISEIDWKLNISTEPLDTWAQAMEETRKEIVKDLGNMAADSKFSEKILAAYDKVASSVINTNKKITDSTKKTIADVALVTVDPMKVASNRAAAQLEAMEMPGFTTSKKGKKRFSGLLGPGLEQFEDQEGKTATIIGTELATAKERLKELEDLNSQELQLSEEMNAKKLALLEAYNEKVRLLQMVQNKFVFGTSAKMFEDLASMAETWGGRQSAFFKTMFAMSKAFAIAESIVNIQMAIAKAMSGLPWPANLVAVAQVVAATSGLVSTIASTTLEFGGKRALGGPVSPGSAFLVGEKGPELFTPSERGNIVPNDQLGGSVLRVVVNNYTDVQPQIVERQEGNEKVVEILMRRMNNELSSSIRDGRGDVTKALESTFTLRRGR